MLFVETHERVGRRIFTRRYGATLVPIEAGAEFIHGSAPELTCLQAGRASSRSWCDPIKRDTPTINEPQLGDQATIFGARFRSEWFYAGAIFSILKQHEVDDRGRRFNGNGFEIALRQHFTEWAWIEGAYNDLSPDSDHPGDFRIRFGAANLAYSFSVASRVFFGFKLENSLRSDGTDLAESAFAAGLNYTF